MVFSTTVFLFYFLPITLLVYYLVPKRFRNVVLLLASLFFYFWGERYFAIIMIISTAVDYTHGLIVMRCKEKNNIKGAKIAVASSMIINLGMLIFFKYWDFIATSLSSLGISFMPVLGIHLPIGISFFTFQTMSYTIDVYRGDADAQKNILNFGTYVTLFPQLIAGPIIKYKDLGEQIDKRDYLMDRFSLGVCTFVIGLSKKLLLANGMGELWEIYKNMPSDKLTVLGAWIGAICYTLQIYFDFSGYSDMAIGLGRMLGFEFKENFNYPYIANSITDFWRRWHISLSTWFKEYLYIPLGGNRVGRVKWLRNLFLVWAATGIWHGASWNYLVWGLYFFVLLMLEKLVLSKVLEKLPGVIKHIYALVFIVIGWVIFGIEDISKAVSYLGKMFGIGASGAVASADIYYARNNLVMIIIAIIASMPLAKNLYEKLPKKVRNIIGPVLLMLGLILCTAFMIAGTYNPFLYFRF